MNNKVKIVILAGGQGKRMQSDTPKSFITVRGRPMLEHIHESAGKAQTGVPLTVISNKARELFESKFKNLPYHIQSEPLGTAHAVLDVKEKLRDAENIAVFYGDQPFLSSDTIKKLISAHLESEAEVTLATTEVPNFEGIYKSLNGFGRIIREYGKFKKIVEYKDATGEEKKIKEVNPGYYVFKSSWLWPNLEKIENKNAQGEYYLTDLLHIAEKTGAKIESIKINPRETLGANSKEELEILEHLE